MRIGDIIEIENGKHKAKYRVLRYAFGKFSIRITEPQRTKIGSIRFPETVHMENLSLRPEVVFTNRKNEMI